MDAGDAVRALARVAGKVRAESAKMQTLRRLALSVSEEVAPGRPDAARALAEAILEHLVYPGDVEPGCSTLLDNFRRAWSARLECLFTSHGGSPDVAANLDIQTNLVDLVEALVRDLPSTIGLYARDVEPLRHVAHELRANLLHESLLAQERDTVEESLLPLHTRGQQALQVRAFVQYAGVPAPTVYVDNDSDGPVTDVRVACWLIAVDPAGQTPIAMIGSTIPFLVVSEVPPKTGWAWPLGHASKWNDQTRVKSQLHLYFTDASGQRWFSGHDRLKALP